MDSSIYRQNSVVSRFDTKNHAPVIYCFDALCLYARQNNATEQTTASPQEQYGVLPYFRSHMEQTRQRKHALDTTDITRREIYAFARTH